MKKIIVLMLAAMLLPVSAKAMEYTDVFNIGDRVEVHIKDDENKQEFFVIKPSASGEQFVWMFLNGNIEDTEDFKNSITVYDETVPPLNEEDEGHEATTVLEDALIYKVLVKGTEGWRAEERRLLTLSDLADLGITVGESRKFEIMGNRKFMAPVRFESAQSPSEYNFWTQIADEEAENASVFAVTYNENYAGDSLTPLATLESYDITSITNNPEFVVRPVVKVDKQYIDCVLTDGTTTKVKDVQTSQVQMPLAAIGVIGLATAAYVLIKKKEVFQKI